MNIRVFQAGKGDSLLLTAADGTRVLVDGGMRADYQRHVAPALAALARRDAALDLVYVSHIDRDHISGVLQLLDDTVAWRVHDYQHASGNGAHPQPAAGRPPLVRDLWHNAFHELVGANSGEIEAALTAQANVLATSSDLSLRILALEQRELATSIAEGIELSRRAGPEQLGIPVNRHFAGRLALVRQGASPIALGSLTLTVIGPFAADLRKLRQEWNAWLRDNSEQLQRLRDEMRRDADRLGTSDFDRLRRLLALAPSALGDRSKVTTPNLASLMLLVEENGRTLLLTGDGHRDDILRGLDRAGRLDGEGGLHVDVLKVQHHGSEHNLDLDFARRITADRYLFCANGEHENPDPRVVQAIVDSRLGSASQRSTNPLAARKFRLQFNSSPDALNGDEREHMVEVERLATSAAAASAGRLACSFLTRSSFQIRLS
jgi:hypothetical protein